MAAKENNLDVLRGETEQLGTRIRRLGFLLIAFLIIVTVTITNAFEKVDLREIHEELEQASQVATSALDMYLNGPSPEESKQLSREEIEKEKDRRQELWEKARQKETETKRKYDALLKESFSITPSLLGSTLSLDLRLWIYTLPFILVICVLYISILRKKQKILSILASEQIKGDISTNTLNRLAFSTIPNSQTPFSRTPSDLEQVIYIVITVFLVTQIISSAADVKFINLGLGLTYSLQYMFMFLTVFFYATAYYFFTSDALDRQVRRITRTARRQSIVIIIWNRLGAILTQLIRRMKPKVSLTTGSLLVLASLFLSTAASCGGADGFVRKPGYTLLMPPGGKVAELEWRTNRLEQLLKEPESGVDPMDWRDPGGGWWISTVLEPKGLGLYWQQAIHSLGRYAYVVGMIVALATLVLVLISLVRRFEKLLRKPQTMLFVLSTTLSLIVVVDFAFNTYWFKDELFLVSNLLWIAPTGLLVLRVSSKRTTSRTRRQLIMAWRILPVLLTPLVLSASVYVLYVTTKGFFGILAYFVGINLLSVTYLNLVSQPVRTQRES